MYKILIAEGEDVIGECIKENIEDCFPIGVQIEIARTGRKAIEISEILCPDILIVDLQISGINGIEVMREIKSMHPNVKMVAVSTSGKCEYVREAIELGVVEYLNKPLEKKELEKSFQKLVAKLEEEKRKRSDALAVKEKIELLTPMLENGLMNCILYGQENQTEIERYCVMLDMEERTGYILLLRMEECFDKENFQQSGENNNYYLNKMHKEIHTAMEKRLPGCVSKVIGKQIVTFVPQKQAVTQEKELYGGIIEKVRKIVQDLKRDFRLKCKLGISEIYEVYHMSKALEEARAALEYPCSEMVVHVSDISFGKEQEENYPISLERNLFNSIEIGDLNNIVYCIREYLQWMCKGYEQHTMDVKLKVLELILRAELLERECEGRTYSFVGHGKYLAEIMEINSCQQLQCWLEEKMIEVCKNICSKKEKNNVDVVKKAKEFIKNNYAKDIDLDEVSQYLQMSPYYFSKLFKKKTGKNFIEYLTQIRLEHAKMLLTNSCKSMKEICMEVGYCDANYFSRLFKKNVGVSPTEYKLEKFGA